MRRLRLSERVGLPKEGADDNKRSETQQPTHRARVFGRDRSERAGRRRRAPSFARDEAILGGRRHKTSVSLEDAFWIELRSIAHNLGVHLSQLVGSIDSARQHSNLSSAIRLFVFECRTHAVRGEALSPAAQAVLAGAKRQTAPH